MESYKIKRKNALPLGAAIKEYLQAARLTTGLNTRLIFKAWDDVSGAGPFTLKRYFRSGKLYITLSSSVVLNQLSARKEFLKEMLNDRLSRDELFEQDDKNATWVEEIILK